MDFTFSTLLGFLICVKIATAITVESNLLQIFPVYDNASKICAGIALNDKYFATTQICAAKASTYVHVRVRLNNKGSSSPIHTEVTFNPKFTVGWNNNFVIGKMPKVARKPKSMVIKKTDSESPDSLELVAFKSPQNSEIFRAKVTILNSKICKNAEFAANEFFKFDEKTEICAEISTSETLNPFHYGAILIDEAENNLIGLLAIMEEGKRKKKNANKIVAVFTKLSTNCDYIESQSNFVCS